MHLYEQTGFDTLPIIYYKSLDTKPRKICKQKIRKGLAFGVIYI